MLAADQLLLAIADMGDELRTATAEAIGAAISTAFLRSDGLGHAGALSLREVESAAWKVLYAHGSGTLEEHQELLQVGKTSKLRTGERAEMSTQQPSPDEPLPGWTAIEAAQAVYGKHLAHVVHLIPVVLYVYVMDRQGIAAAHNAGRQDVIDAQAASIAMERRDDLLQAAVVLDALALFHGHGSYLPRPCPESCIPAPRDVELRTDASDVAGELARHDQQYGTSATGAIPAPLEDGCTDSDREAVRAYARREWITRQERWPGV
ncbi:hypothetical protein YW3DRAFT_05846 [Streptomyces sp. MnatMP-M77]|uniref:hypothetical protein n=1 Tax=unclassified Streptomyces TaxID=2593676 RepID=UPI000805A4E5|nr:hypothetical protein [Streptomyces sp. MnatMP-M77]MYT82453.1 hypothetical protein [Streptomyces sp. SID8364]SBU96702.1 hypothetical protein YW3DRAFT_05846 [Streptomyces sp. MnatMP-M77]